MGLDKWQWIPRGALILLVGLVLCLPAVVRRLRDAPEGLWAPSPGNGPLALRAVVLLIEALSAGVWFVDPVAIRGSLPRVGGGRPRGGRSERRSLSGRRLGRLRRHQSRPALLGAPGHHHRQCPGPQGGLGAPHG
ncbi:hypothetical protein ACU4GR_05590 [Methylobacterium oryzae CBMB20]